MNRKDLIIDKNTNQLDLKQFLNKEILILLKYKPFTIKGILQRIEINLYAVEIIVESSYSDIMFTVPLNELISIDLIDDEQDW